MSEIQSQYYNWMCNLISNKDINAHEYDYLLAQMDNIDFMWIIPLDENRSSDGIELRYRFGVEEGIHDAVIACELDTRPCSVLEMMIALALRCEDEIMQDTEERHVDRWFWVMMTNLGLLDMTNDRYDSDRVNYIIKKLLNRTYGIHGAGGLVSLPNRPENLRTVEIWYQVMWYLDTVVKGE